jgi:predicted nuclease with TOPRIM domain
MKAEIQQRFDVLRTEFEKGQERLLELRIQESHLQETLLRIDGTMTVLRELLDREQPKGEVTAASEPAAAQHDDLP